MKKFSIVIAVCNRIELFKRCLLSIIFFQEYDDFEIVVIDDNSDDDIYSLVKSFNTDKIRYFKQEVRMERVMAYKRGFNEAMGEWVMHMGSDDMMFPKFLSFLEKQIEKYPDYKLFNYGWTVINRHNGKITSTPGHDFPDFQHFDSGLIAAGSFCWHYRLTEQIEFPNVLNCYEFADKANIPGYSGKTRTLGNPWGEDYYIWWKLTRRNKSMRLPLFGTIVHIR